MQRAESLEPASDAGAKPSFSFDKFFHDAHDKGIVAAVEEHPAEAAVTAVGTVAAGAAALYLTRGRVLAGIFRNGVGEEVAANPNWLASLSRTGFKPLPLGQLEPDVARLATGGLPLSTESRAVAVLRTSGFPLAADKSAAAFLRTTGLQATAENRVGGALPSALKAKPWLGQSVDMGAPAYTDGAPLPSASAVKTFSQATYEYVPHNTAPLSEPSVMAEDATSPESPWNLKIGPATDALIKDGIPISPLNRAVASNTTVLKAQPWARESAIRGGVEYMKARAAQILPEGTGSAVTDAWYGEQAPAMPPQIVKTISAVTQNLGAKAAADTATIERAANLIGPEGDPTDYAGAFNAFKGGDKVVAGLQRGFGIASNGSDAF